MIPLINYLRIHYLVGIYFILVMSIIQSHFVPTSDSDTYLYYFEHLAYQNYTEGLKDLNFGYYYFNLLGGYIFHKDSFFLFNCIFLYSLVFSLAYQLSKKNFLLLFCLICFLGFSNNVNFLIRQYYSSIILLMVFLSYSDAKKNSIVKVGLYTLALSFHTSVMLFIPLFFKKIRGLMLKHCFKLIIISFLLSFFFNVSFLQYLYSFSDVFPLFDKLRYYQNSSELYSLPYHRLVMSLILFGFLMGVNVEHLSEKDKVFQALLIYSMILYVGTSGVSVFATRIGFFIEFFIGVFFYIPLKYKNKFSLFYFKFNPTILIWICIFFKAILWGIMNEHSHIIKYFNGELLSSGWFSL